MCIYTFRDTPFQRKYNVGENSMLSMQTQSCDNSLPLFKLSSIKK